MGKINSSTKRQSYLEIRTHNRLLPRRVGKVSEQSHLLKKRDRLRQWAIQKEVEKTDEPELVQLLQANNKVIKLSQKYFSESRRQRFDKLNQAIHIRESQFITKIKSPPSPSKWESDNDNNAEDENHNEFSTPPSFFNQLIQRILSLFCKQN